MLKQYVNPRIPPLDTPEGQRIRREIRAGWIRLIKEGAPARSLLPAMQKRYPNIPKGTLASYKFYKVSGFRTWVMRKAETGSPTMRELAEYARNLWKNWPDETEPPKPASRWRRWLNKNE